MNLYDIVADAVRDGTRDVTRGLVREGTRALVKHGTRIGVEKARKGISSLSLTDNTYLGYSWPKWFTRLLTQESGGVYLALGKRHSGKTTMQVALAEYGQAQTGAAIYFPGYPKRKAPKHIIPVEEGKMYDVMLKAPPGSYLIIDDASRFDGWSAYRSMSSESMVTRTWVNQLAHQGVHVLINLQDSSELHKAGLRADVLLFKPPERMFEGSERQVMRPLIREAVTQFRRLPEEQWVSHAWVYKDPDHKAMIKIRRPNWMTADKAKYRGHAFDRSVGSGDRRDWGNGGSRGLVSNLEPIDITGSQGDDVAFGFLV